MSLNIILVLGGLASALIISLVFPKLVTSLTKRFQGRFYWFCVLIVFAIILCSFYLAFLEAIIAVESLALASIAFWLYMRLESGRACNSETPYLLLALAYITMLLVIHTVRIFVFGFTSPAVRVTTMLVSLTVIAAILFLDKLLKHTLSVSTSQSLTSFEIRLTIVVLIISLVGGAIIYSMLWERDALGILPSTQFDMNIIELVSMLMIFMPLSILQIACQNKVKATGFVLGLVAILLAASLVGVYLLQLAKRLMDMPSYIFN